MPRYKLRTCLYATTIAAIAVYVGVFAWGAKSHQIRDADIRINQKLEISTFKDPHYLEIWLSGEIDGEAIIVSHNGMVTAIGPGPFSKKVQGECYVKNSSHRIQT